MVFVGLSVLGLMFQVSASNAVSVRDVNGNWRSLSWVKRSNPGDVLKVPLTNHNDKSYSTPVRMGTPFQTIEMALSLSQNHIAVESPDTKGTPGYYDSSASQSFVQGDATTPISTLHEQSVVGSFSSEACEILDFSYQASVAITPSYIKMDLYPEGSHGILGYGVDPSPEVPKDINSTLLGVYIPNPPPSEAECGFELNRAEDGVGGGLFTMGNRDPTAFSGDFTKMNVPAATSVDRPSWSIEVDNVTANISGSVQNLVQSSLASIDLYYPTISLPAKAVKTLYSQVAEAVVSPNNSCRYIVPCNATIDLTMTFGGKNFNLDRRDAITKEGDVCYGTVEVGKGSVHKIGSPFLRNVYTIFGATFNNGTANFTVGFADKVQRVADPSATSTTGGASSTTSGQSLPASASVSSSPTNAATSQGPPAVISILVIASLFTIMA